ncbi:hypothetical protein GGR56DRAFT_469473 [Xylariaceae sp. FL0804]|nr:hypothetical protein GGR56DRAFT_469473 [Xylariaceae sp. FL0804]
MKFVVASLIVALAGTASALAHPPPPPPPPPGHPSPTPTPTSTSTSTSTSSTTTPTLTIGVTTVSPGSPTSVTGKPACPTVTFTTRPSGCDPLLCPLPGCTLDEDMLVPCGCAIATALFVDGCQTACPAGCATSTRTLSEICDATPVPDVVML